jgi:hypothetical protein
MRAFKRSPDCLKIKDLPRHVRGFWAFSELWWLTLRVFGLTLTAYRKFHS